MDNVINMNESAEAVLARAKREKGGKIEYREDGTVPFRVEWGEDGIAYRVYRMDGVDRSKWVEIEDAGLCCDIYYWDSPINERRAFDLAAAWEKERN